MNNVIIIISQWIQTSAFLTQTTKDLRVWAVSKTKELRPGSASGMTFPLVVHTVVWDLPIWQTSPSVQKYIS
jgi:hypothetical protein